MKTYQLYWTSSDGQSEIPMGEGTTEPDQKDIDFAKREMLTQAGTDADIAEIEAGSFRVVYQDSSKYSG